MGLPDSYTLKPNAIPAYFDAIINAQPPERFSQRFLEGLGFKSSNDRLVIGVLKDLGFLDVDGKPTERYFRYLDRGQSERVLAEGIRDAYSDLFAVRSNAQEFSVDEAKDKLRTLYAGKKSDTTIGRIASTFAALCEIADFSDARPSLRPAIDEQPAKKSVSRDPAEPEEPVERELKSGAGQQRDETGPIGFGSLQYHVNIVLPESRDQAVYDAIFKALRDHLD